MTDKKKLTPKHRDATRNIRVKQVDRKVLSPEADVIQNELIKQGYVSFIEIMFRTSNDLYEDLTEIGEQYGITSEEYSKKVAELNAVAKTTAPFFVKEKDIKVNLNVDVEEEIKALLAKNKKFFGKGDDNESESA